MMLLMIAACICIVTNIFEEFKSWKFEGLSSILTLVRQVFKINRTQDHVQTDITWPKKVGVALLVTCAGLFAFILKWSNENPDKELVKVSGLMIPFWILGVILPLMEILGNKNMLQFVKVHNPIFRRLNAVQPIYPVVV